jgi:hypothetical protein
MKIFRKLIIGLFLAVFIPLLFFFILNIEVSTEQGINYVVHSKKIPLYLKMLDFFDRHYQYRYLVKEITQEANTDEDRVLAIFDWTHKNIRKTPDGFPIVDDHVWNIIVRGYGEMDQSADVFTTLCVYAGIPAAMYKVYTKDLNRYIVVSMVYLNEKWRIFDTFFGNYFRTKGGEIASIGDIIELPSIVGQARNQPVIKGIEYTKFFENLTPINDKTTTLRPQLHMPISRIIYMIKRKLNLTKKAILFYGTRHTK